MSSSRLLLFQPSTSPRHIISAPSTTINIGGHSVARLHYSNRKEFTVAEKLKSNVGVAGYCINYHYERNNIVGQNKNNLKRWRSKSTGCPNYGLPSADEDYNLVNVMKALIAPLKIFYTFTRPYACMGTVLGVVSGSLIAIENLSDISPSFLIGLFKVIAAFGFLMIYGTGINQLFDIDIDKVNKPYLPLASGEMNLETGITIVVVSTLLAFAITYVVGSRPLLCGICMCFLMFSAYSVNDQTASVLGPARRRPAEAERKQREDTFGPRLPFLRWKRNEIGAALSILSSRGIVIQLSSFFHMQTFVLGRQANFSRSLAFGTIVVSIVSAVIALFKDITDIEGDKKFGINSFAASLGKKQVFWISVYLLEMTYIFAIPFGATSSHLWSKLITIFGHAVLASILWKRAKSIDLNDKSAITSFYMLIWKLFYVEFLLIPFVR